MEVFLGIDWGGTYIKSGLVDSRGKIIKQEVYASKSLRDKDIFIKRLEKIIVNYEKYKIKGVGIGAPGIIDIKKGFIYYLPNVPGWERFPLKRILEKRLKIPVFIDNDANVFALAETRLGAAKGKSRVIFLTLGTGLGGAILINGRPVEGRTSSLELGHVAMSLGGIKCGCGASGCIETMVGSNYLLKRYNKLIKAKKPVKEVRVIFQKALKGQREALIVWKEFSQSLGRFLRGMINIFNPEVIVFGGGVSGAFKIFKPLVWQVIKEETMWPQLEGLKLVKAKIRRAGITGAALLAKDKLS